MLTEPGLANRTQAAILSHAAGLLEAGLIEQRDLSWDLLRDLLRDLY